MEDEIVMTMGQGTKCHEEIALDVRGRQEDLLRPDDLMRHVFIKIIISHHFKISDTPFHHEMESTIREINIDQLQRDGDC
jgi:hypothetical protein